MSPMTVMQAPSPGWYPDPSGAGQRYYDGTGWTGYRTLSDVERTEVLSAAVAYEVSRRGARVESQTALAAVLVYGSQCNHVAWLLAGLFTCGTAWIAWAVVAFMQHEQRRTLRVDPYGSIVFGA